jgi:GT2 family glycosyltransferase
MKYDLIIVTRSTTDYLREMTQRCIDSARADRVIIVETGQVVAYNNIDVYTQYPGKFNYNACLNWGLEFAENDIHILANNDLIFHKYRSIGYHMKENGFDSGSAWYKRCMVPQGDYIYPGYEVGFTLTGWCIFITKETYKKIGLLDEGVDFWYSDNLYAEQLKKHNLKHGLFCNTRVDHLTNQTLNTMPLKLKREYSIGQLAKYESCRKRK